VTARTAEARSIWKKRVEGLEASGRSCREYAKQIGVNAQTLAGWRWKLRQRGSTLDSRPAPETTCELVDVTRQVAAALARETGVIEVEVGSVVVRVRGEVDGKMLARVLRAVGGRR
jgi:transposase-like protein